VLDVLQRIAALVDQVLEPLGLGTGIAGSPTVAPADRKTPLLAATAHGIGEHVAPRAGGGDASAEALHGVVIGDLVACGRRFEAPDASVGEVFGWHVQIPVSSLCAANLALAMSNFLHPVSKLVHRKAWFFRGLDRKRPENQAQARVWQRGRVRRNVWSFAPVCAEGKANRWSGCADGLPTG